MTELRQNFSLICGDDTDIDYGIVPPPDPPFDMTQVDMTWTAYPEVRGVADKTLAVITKTTDSGIEIEDAETYEYVVILTSTDTTPLSGNYYYEVVVVDPTNNNRRSTPTIGIMTVIDTAKPINVVAFKSMFPEFMSVDDSVVQTALDEALLFVDDTNWNKMDVQAAIFYLAAHFISTAQAAAGSSGRVVSSESIGQISISYGTASDGSSGGGYPSLSNSSYGLMFLAVMRRNSPGIAIV